MGVKPTYLCTQLGSLADLLKNKVNRQQNVSWYEVWNQKCAEDASKWEVTGFYRPTTEVPGVWHQKLRLQQGHWRRASSMIVAQQLSLLPGWRNSRHLTGETWIHNVAEGKKKGSEHRLWCIQTGSVVTSPGNAREFRGSCWHLELGKEVIWDWLWPG